MKQTPPTFLTQAQAIDAIAADFSQYGVQPDLFRDIGPLILGNDFKAGSCNEQNGAWIRHENTQPFQKVDDERLRFYFVHLLETGERDLETIKKICERVFETPVRPGDNDGKPGVWIENQMNDFVCKRCGHCCRGLEHVCANEDRHVWKNHGRSDILSWVQKKTLIDGIVQYSIWVDPITGKPTDICPFLAPMAGGANFLLYYPGGETAGLPGLSIYPETCPYYRLQRVCRLIQGHGLYGI